MTRQTATPTQAQTSTTHPLSQGGILQRKCATCGQHTVSGRKCTECKKSSPDQYSLRHPSQLEEAPNSVQKVLNSSGHTLDPENRAFMEARFGHDFSSVRVHSDAQAAESARSVNALAYTVGNHIVFARQYAPETASYGRLLAHELTHVVQQNIGGGSGPHYAKVISHPSDTAEIEAETTAERVMQGGVVQVTQPASAVVQGLSIGEGIGIGIGAVAGAGLLGLGIAAAAGAFSKNKNNALQRQCDLFFERIRQHPVYRSLENAVRTLADEIMTIAMQRNNCLYYAEKLLLLFNTPEAPPATSGQPPPQGSTLERNRRAVEQAAQEEQTRLSTPEAQREVGRQEQVANDPTRQWTRRRGHNGKIFYVDRSDPNNIVVRIKVRLLAARGVTTPQDITNERLLEDAIERVAETRGYTIDVVFVDRDGPDVFTYQVDFDRWPTAANPVGNARTLAHEIHHLLGLDDRYDYIESHAANRNMAIPTRLHWFRQQMDRQPDPNRDVSLMGRGRTMLDDDICRVAGLDLQTCMAARARGAVGQ